MDYKILDEKESFAAWFAQMAPDAQAQFAKFGHNRAEPIFIDRIFYLYKCMGRGNDPQKSQRPPEVLAVIRVINFAYTLDKGFMVSLLNETTNEKQVLMGIPAKVFGFDVFACVPTSFTIRFNQIVWLDGRKQFDTSLAIYVKTANKADFYSYKNFYLETPKRMASLYPGIDWRPDRS